MTRFLLDRSRIAWLQLRREGPVFVLRRIGNLVRHRLVPPWENLYWLPAEGVPEAPVAQQGLELAVLDDLSVLQEDQHESLARSLGPHTLPTVERRLRAGAELHVLRSKGSVAGTWFAVHGGRRAFQHIPLTEGDVMVLDLRIDPNFRGQGLAVPFLHRSARDLRARGTRRIFATVSATNLASQRTFERAGFRLLLRMRRRRGRYRFDQGHVR